LELLLHLGKITSQLLEKYFIYLFIFFCVFWIACLVYSFSLKSKRVAQKETDTNLVLVDGWYFLSYCYVSQRGAIDKHVLSTTRSCWRVSTLHTCYQPHTRAGYVSTITCAMFKQHAGKHNTAPPLTFQNRRAVKLPQSVISSPERNDIFW